MDAIEYNKARGYSRSTWAAIQTVIGAEADGIPGQETASKLAAWQQANGLSGDGKCGPRTMDRLRPFLDEHEQPSFIGTERVDCDLFTEDHGYDRTTVRADFAMKLRALRGELNRVGLKLTSAGGLRKLSAEKTPGRSSTSLHHLGLAHDLATYSGMGDPRTDAYLVTAEVVGGRYHWTLWGKQDLGEIRTLDVVTRGNVVRWEGAALNITEIAADFGITTIPSRSCYPRTYGCAEWWHLQDVTSLVRGDRYGDILEMVWPRDEVLASSMNVPDRSGKRLVDARWNGGYFD